MTQMVMVYGSLRQGFWNSHLLDSSEFHGTHRLSIPFKMLDLGSFPGLVHTPDKHKITIELYEVSDVVFKTLDHLEGYPHFYDRVKMVTDAGDAWIYYLAEPEDYIHAPVVKSGNWVHYVGQQEDVA